MTPAVASCRSRSQSSQIIIIIIWQSLVVLPHHPQVNMDGGGWSRVLALGAGNNREISNDHLNPSTSSQSSGLKSVRLLEGGSRGTGGVDKSKLSCVPCDDAQNENSNP